MEFKGILDQHKYTWARETPAGQAQYALAQHEIDQYKKYASNYKWGFPSLVNGTVPSEREIDETKARQYRSQIDGIISEAVQAARLAADIEVAKILGANTINTNTHFSFSRNGPGYVNLRVAQDVLSTLRSHTIEAYQGLLRAMADHHTAQAWIQKYYPAGQPNLVDLIHPEDDGTDQYKAYKSMLDEAEASAALDRKRARIQAGEVDPDPEPKPQPEPEAPVKPAAEEKEKEVATVVVA